MKRLAILAALLLFIWILAYAGFAFILWQADPGEWSTDARLSFVWLCAVFSFLLVELSEAKESLI